MVRAYIGVGSNHNPAENLQQGLGVLREKVEVVAASPVYESPSSDGDDSHYLNAVLAIETDLAPVEIKALLVEVEAQCERVRIDANGEKSKVVALDFDLLMVDDIVETYDFKGKTYRLPHSDIVTRAYAAVPLAHIAGKLEHPETMQKIITIAAQFTESELVLRTDIQLKV